MTSADIARKIVKNKQVMRTLNKQQPAMFGGATEQPFRLTFVGDPAVVGGGVGGGPVVL